MTLVNYKTANNASSTLASGIGAGATSLVCATGQGGRFPSTYPFLITIEKTVSSVVTKREIVKVTNRSSDAFTIVRSSGYCLASDSATTQTNTAQSFDADDVISLRLTGEIIDDLNAEAVRLETDKLDVADYQNGEKVYASSSTGTDAYAITLDPPITAYVLSQTFKFSADVANTGAATLNVNGLGAKTIKKQHDVDLASGDIEVGQFVYVTYDGTNFQMNSQIATIPTVDINGETEDTAGDMDADFIHVYDNSAGANRKQKPNVYRASDAEAIAQSVNTKFVTPANLAAITSFNSLIQPVGYQELGTYVAADTWAPKYCTCLSDGFSSSNSIYVACSNGGSAYCTIFCFKFQDGFFYGVSSASSTATAGNATTLAAIGNYVYSWRTALQRFDKDTLANTTTITVSGTAMTNNTPIFAIGSDLYNVYTTGTAKKYTISGTTATSSTDVSYTSMGAASTDNTWSDGTYVYQQYTSGADLGVYRWAIAGGARTTLSTYKIRITSSTPTDVGTLKQSGKNILIRLLTQGNGTFNISPIPIT